VVCVFSLHHTSAKVRESSCLWSPASSSNVVGVLAAARSTTPALHQLAPSPLALKPEHTHPVVSVHPYPSLEPMKANFSFVGSNQSTEVTFLASAFFKYWQKLY
jgi:hypothetical protein